MCSTCRSGTSQPSKAPDGLIKQCCSVRSVVRNFNHASVSPRNHATANKLLHRSRPVRRQVSWPFTFSYAGAFEGAAPLSGRPLGVTENRPHHDMKARAFVSLLLSFLLLACPWAPPHGSFHERVMRASAAGQPTVDFVARANTPWQFGYFFAPYTVEADIDATIGFHCEDCHLIELDKRDDLDLLLLVANSHVVKLEELPRSDLEIDPAILRRAFAPRTRFAIGSRRPVHVGPATLPPVAEKPLQPNSS